MVQAQSVRRRPVYLRVSPVPGFMEQFSGVGDIRNGAYPAARRMAS